MRKLTTKLLSRAAACEALGVCARTFSQHWARVFTDPRDPADQRRGVARRVFEDELAVAVEAGGGVSGRAKAAVIAYRSDVGRSRNARPGGARSPQRAYPRSEPQMPGVLEDLVAQVKRQGEVLATLIELVQASAPVPLTADEEAWADGPLTVKEAATWLKVSEGQVAHLVRAGKIVSAKDGRRLIAKRGLLRYLAAHQEHREPE